MTAEGQDLAVPRSTSNHVKPTSDKTRGLMGNGANDCMREIVVQTFTFPHGRSPHYTNVYTFTRSVLCQISSATKLTTTVYQLARSVLSRSLVELR